MRSNRQRERLLVEPWARQKRRNERKRRKTKKDKKKKDKKTRRDPSNTECFTTVCLLTSNTNSPISSTLRRKSKSVSQLSLISTFPLHHKVKPTRDVDARLPESNAAVHFIRCSPVFSEADAIRRLPHQLAESHSEKRDESCHEKLHQPSGRATVATVHICAA